MVEDIRLIGLIACPGDGVGEAVEYQRQAVCGRAQLSDQLGHLLMDARMLAQVVFDVGAEGADVGDSPGIGRFLAGLGQCAVPTEQFALLAVQVLAKQQKTLQAGDLFRAEETDAGLVEQQAALERQRQPAEKTRKEAEFKSAPDAMNQRANVKRTDEVVGEMSETPEQAAQRKKKRVGYDATKVTGILGAAPTESKKLLGM